MSCGGSGDHARKPPKSVSPAARHALATAASHSRWPDASTTGANPALVTSTLPISDGWYSSDARDLTITNAEIDGGVNWTGTGTLTLRNVILRPDWAKVWATVMSTRGGSVVMDHVTIKGVNVGAPGNYTKGFLMEGDGSLDVGYSNISGICQNDVGGGPFDIHDNYIHDIGSGNGATCHATPIEDVSGGAEPRVIQHNDIDEFPGRDFENGTDGAVFLQGLYGKIAPITIKDNYLHAGYWSIEISGNGRFPVSGPAVINNCLAWPSTGAPVSDPGKTIKIWRGNTRCDDHGHDTEEPVPGR